MGLVKLFALTGTCVVASNFGFKQVISPICMSNLKQIVICNHEWPKWPSLVANFCKYLLQEFQRLSSTRWYLVFFQHIKSQISHLPTIK
jgi:hypothetical protein